MEGNIMYANQIFLVSTDSDLTIKFVHIVPEMDEQGNITMTTARQQLIVMSQDQADKFLLALKSNIDEHAAKKEKIKESL